MIDKPVVFSNHARERVREFGLSLAKANFLIYTGDKDEQPKEIKKYKRAKYQERAIYIRNGTNLFTLIPLKDKLTEEDIYLVVSMYDQRLDL